MPGGFIPPEQMKSLGSPQNLTEPRFCGEAYKNNMYALLGKPGYEDKKAELEARL